MNNRKDVDYKYHDIVNEFISVIGYYAMDGYDVYYMNQLIEIAGNGTVRMENYDLVRPRVYDECTRKQCRKELVDRIKIINHHKNNEDITEECMKQFLGKDDKTFDRVDWEDDNSRSSVYHREDNSNGM